jgi:ATP-binding cassette, subfamily B, bacterial
MFTKNPIISLMLTGWRFAGSYRPLFVLYLAMFAAAQAISLCEPYIIGKIINCVQTSADKGFKDWTVLMNEINVYLLWFLALQIAFWAFHGPGRCIERVVAFQIRTSYKSHMFNMVTQRSLSWHRSHHSGDSIDKINRASNSLCLFFDESFETAYMLFRMLGSLVVLSLFMPEAGWIAIITSTVSMVAIFCFDRVLYGKYADLNKYDNAVASAIHDYVTNIISIITLRLDGRVLGEVKKKLHVSLPLFKNTNIINELKWCLTTILIGVMIVAVLAWYTHSTLSSGKALMGGTFFTLFEYLRRIGDSFYNFASIYGNTTRQAADVYSASPLMEPEGADVDQVEATLPESWKTIEIRGLHFVYEDEKHRQHHLENIAIELHRGKSIAFVGESGSGKSTLLNLLRGMQTAAIAEVICDGQVLPGELAHLAQHTTLLPQDPELFADSILFNITFGLEADAAELEAAVKLARFDSVLNRLPNGYATNIAEKGINLSGGEKQRLALARGLFFAKDSDIVLLDEPTSSVDPQNEGIIYRNILAKFADKCIISSIHKLHLLDLFDMIYVFDNGRIVESGTLPELIALDGFLARQLKRGQASKDGQLVTAG